MKTFMTAMFLGVMALSLMSTGCATPGYSGFEEASHTVRNIDLQNKQMIEEINLNLLLDPGSLLSEWNLR